MPTMDLSMAKNTEHKKTDPAGPSLLLGGRLILEKPFVSVSLGVVSL